MNPTYQKSDVRSLEFHRLVASKLKLDPSLINQALDNIHRWKKQNNFPQPYLEDWISHIDRGMDHLLAFLISESDEAQRLRSSSPFVGDCFVTQDERKEISEKNR